MEDYIVALDGWRAELRAWIEAERAKLEADEKPAEQPPLPDSPTDPA